MNKYKYTTKFDYLFKFFKMEVYEPSQVIKQQGIYKYIYINLLITNYKIQIVFLMWYIQ